MRRPFGPQLTLRLPKPEVTTYKQQIVRCWAPIWKSTSHDRSLTMICFSQHWTHCPHNFMRFYDIRGIKLTRFTWEGLPHPNDPCLWGWMSTFHLQFWLCRRCVQGFKPKIGGGRWDSQSHPSDSQALEHLSKKHWWREMWLPFTPFVLVWSWRVTVAPVKIAVKIKHIVLALFAD